MFVGDDLTYTIEVSNAGPSVAQSVVVTDTLPVGVGFVQASTDQGSVSEANGIVTTQLGDVGAGLTVNISVSVAAENLGTVTNNATVISVTNDPDKNNNRAGVSTTIQELPTTTVLINEVDADTPGADSMEFIELFDGGSGNSSLGGMVIVLFNGTDDRSYKAFDLDGKKTNANGLFVLGNENIADVDLVIPNNTLQNGPDAVALYFGDAADFPNDTPLTTSKLVDAVVYDTGDPDDIGLLTLLNPGQPQVDENGGGSQATHSIQRLPNGSGGARNTDSYTAISPTPGKVNMVIPMADLAITKAVDVDPVFLDDHVTYTLVATNNGPDLATKVVVIDTLPNVLSFISADPTQGSCTEKEGLVTCDLGDLAQSGRAEVIVKAATSQTGAVTNRAGIISDTADPEPGNNKASAETVVVPVPSTSVVINEIDSDTPGSDMAEFIELFDSGSGTTTLSGLVLVLFNGSTDLSYAAISLDGRRTNSDGFFVIGSQGVTNVDLVISNATLQNGPDAVALYFGNPTDFPARTPVTTTRLVDALVYGNPDLPDTGLLPLLNPGESQVDENGAGEKDNNSLQRVPNGSGGPRNTATFVPAPPTPGAANFIPLIPDISISDVTLNFDNVLVGKELDLDFVIRNKGNTDLVVDSTRIVGPDADQWLIRKGAAPFVVAVGGDQKVTVCFNPTSMGNKQASVRIRSNDPDEDPLDILLKGTALAPDIDAVAALIQFGSVEIGSEAQESFNLVNAGTAPLQVTEVAIAGSNASLFRTDSVTVPFTLQPEEKRPFAVTFSPDTTGKLKGSVRFKSNDPDEARFFLRLKGEGRSATQADIAVEPDSLAFGPVTISASLSKQVTILSTGTAPLQVGNLTIASGDTGAWQVESGAAPFTLLPGQLNVTVIRYTPTAAGSQMSTLRIVSNARPDSILSIPLAGEGVGPANSIFEGVVVLNEIHYNPATAQGSDRGFEFLELLNTSADQIVPLNNFTFSSGIAHAFQPADSLQAGQFLILAADSSSYPGSIQWDSGNLVNSGEAIVLQDATGAIVDSVQYGIAAPWPSEANGMGPSLELIDALTDNSVAEHWQASLFAGGTPGAANSSRASQAPDISVSVTNLDFGETVLSDSSDGTVTVSNQGTASLVVSETRITGIDSSDWKFAGQTAPFSLQPGENLDLLLRFLPNSVGTKSATLVLRSNDAAQPTVTVTLAGAGRRTSSSDLAGVIVINEIHYNPATAQGSDADFEFIELANTADEAIRLAGVQFDEGILYVFGQTDIPANGFLVVAKNALSYPGSLQWTSGNLVNSGEQITLTDQIGATIDRVAYDDALPWPTAANGDGPSLELKAPGLDNSMADNWQASAAAGGSPGQENSSTALASLEVEPTAYDFGIVNPTTHAEIEFMVTNTGALDVSVTQVEIVGRNADAFSLRDVGSPFSIFPGEEKAVRVLTDPTDPGDKTAVVRLTLLPDTLGRLELPLQMHVNALPSPPLLLRPQWADVARQFVWRAAYDPDSSDALHYIMQVARDVSFNALSHEFPAMTDTVADVAGLAADYEFEPKSFYYWRVKARDDHNAESDYSEAGYFQFGDLTTGVGDDPTSLPNRFSLQQNFPNPFNPQTEIRFELPVQADVDLAIFDLQGRKVRQLLAQERFAAGRHRTTWDGKDENRMALPSGPYFYRIMALPVAGQSGVNITRSMILLK